MENEILPIGTVVLLKGGNVELMIIGHHAKVKTADGEKNFEYACCYVSEGVQTASSVNFFNKEDIEKVVQIGYADEEWNLIKNQFHF